MDKKLSDKAINLKFDLRGKKLSEPFLVEAVTTSVILSNPNFFKHDVNIKPAHNCISFAGQPIQINEINLINSRDKRFNRKNPCLHI